MVAEVDFKALGARLKGDVKKVVAAVKQLTSGQLEEFQETGTMVVFSIYRLCYPGNTKTIKYPRYLSV
jgi:hypothetical protein